MQTTAFSLHAVSDGVLVLRVSGVGSHEAAVLAAELGDHLAVTAAGQRLVVDLTGLEAVSAVTLRIPDARTQPLEEPVLVVSGAPHIAEVFTLLPPRGLRLHPTLDEALAALPDTASVTDGPDAPARTAHGDLRSEVFGLRAKMRTHSLIGTAQGILYERYRLTGLEVAVDLTATASAPSPSITPSPAPGWRPPSAPPWRRSPPPSPPGAPGTGAPSSSTPLNTCTPEAGPPADGTRGGYRPACRDGPGRAADPHGSPPGRRAGAGRGLHRPP
ncbi:hypothetical protein ABZ619_29695 [Streptomyces sp. NPDC007851]|uniref:STAS domain-containing protein n=1 Tax=Streptomyces sp. NPDC007851 TaxID=3155008 RepID=UPI00340CB5A3